MIILGIETSCDETAVAVLKQDPSASSGQAGRIQILSNIVASSASLQAKYGGIIPEQAAREQLKSIIPVIQESLQASGIRPQDLNAIAVTYGPGLIGSLLVGVETAKILSLVWNKPLIPVNHLLGHFWANWIDSRVSNIVYGLSEDKNDIRLTINDKPKFPCIGLLVSGGHTDLVLFKNEQTYEYLGGTRDDAAGECFDKCARVLGYAYPGGPKISKLAEKGNPKAFNLPRPMMEKGDFSAKGGPAYGWDFSFSGLKTSVSNIVYGLSEDKNDIRLTINDKQDLAASIEQAIVDVLVDKTVKAAQKYKVEHIMIAGGVAANQSLVRNLKIQSEKLKVKLHVPPPDLCTDNGAMIASRAFYEKTIDPLKLQANPNLSLD